MRAADSLRFCKFYGEIPIMRIARITVSSKNNKIENACDFSFAFYGNSPLAARGISKSESHCVVIRINKPDKLNEMNCVRLIPAP